MKPALAILLAGTVLTCLSAALAQAPDGPMGVERIARLTPMGYQSGADRDDVTRWVQVDLGETRRIDAVKLFPMTDWGAGSIGFPARFKIEASDDPAFKSAALVADQTAGDFRPPGDRICTFGAAAPVSGRYVRLTVTKLRQKKLCLSKLEVIAEGKDAAEGRPVSDSVQGNLGRTLLTRAPRPNGEGVVTDNPRNVIPASEWKPVKDQIQTPLSGVTLGPGLFRTAMERNVRYLLDSFTVDQLLRPFRDRAGKPNPPGLPKPIDFWETDLPGSNAGRFLMGAGNTLRWMDDPELRRRMNAVVDGIAECRAHDGYIMGYPPNTIFHSERAAYTRSWTTHGLIDAGFAGNPKAFELLRGYYDWFDKNPYLPELLRRGGQGVQGMIANTRMYFTPLGKPEDLQTIQRYFQEDYWLDELARRDPKAIWQYPYDHPHCYLLTSIEPYLDLYRATGAKRYLDAAQGGWDLYHDDWEHVGGSIAICEADVYPPKSYYLHKHTGELCGSTFWANLNQRFHRLYPDQERYVAEIEKSIYNVGLANQGGAKGIRYHANLVGKKDGIDTHNSCCEGQGTRLLGSLPEYLYSIAADGLYVDLFAPSTIEWKQGGATLTAEMKTEFPFANTVRITLSAARPTRSAIRVRVPSWATGPMPIRVNGAVMATGKPGTYVPLTRTWKQGDTIAFTLPAGFRLTRYNGEERTPGRERYALEMGPVLMALVNTDGKAEEGRLALDPATLAAKLKPVEGKPLHYTVEGDAAHEYVPYWEVEEQTFTCYPFVGTGAERVTDAGSDDLALAANGATATSDGEYANEPGCTAKAIDGIVATGGNFSNRWHSSLTTPHPHWIEVKLAKPAQVGRIAIRFADPAGYPTSFQGIVKANDREQVIFDVKGCDNARGYEVKLKPMTVDTFRLIIRASANPAYPNAAQVSEIEIYPPGK